MPGTMPGTLPSAMPSLIPGLSILGSMPGGMMGSATAPQQATIPVPTLPPANAAEAEGEAMMAVVMQRRGVAAAASAAAAAAAAKAALGGGQHGAKSAGLPGAAGPAGGYHTAPIPPAALPGQIVPLPVILPGGLAALPGAPPLGAPGFPGPPMFASAPDLPLPEAGGTAKAALPPPPPMTQGLTGKAGAAPAGPPKGAPMQIAQPSMPHPELVPGSSLPAAVPVPKGPPARAGEEPPCGEQRVPETNSKFGGSPAPTPPLPPGGAS